MPASERFPMRRVWLAVVGVALAAVVGVLLLVRPSPPAPDPVAAPEGSVADPVPLDLPQGATALIFGDSWVYGEAARPLTLGFAYLTGETLGWATTVDGVRGSGYLKPGIDGPTYPERIASLDPGLDPDIVIVEGTINDRRQPAEGYRAAVASSWDALAALYPEARIVILGPAPQVLPIEAATARIDRDLADLAASRSWWYISPIDEDWITVANYDTVIDTSDLGRNHPSVEGHAYLAERLVDAIEHRSGAVVAAEGR